MPSVTERRFDLGGMAVAAREWGAAGGEPIVALHGWLDNAASFDALAEHLSGCHFVALDMPGNGLSDDKPVHATYNIWDDLPIILAVADQMQWQRFTVLGHSRGAMMATLLAASCPERVSRLICLDGLVPGAIDITDTAKQLGDFLRDYRAAGERRSRVYDSLEELIASRARAAHMSEAAARNLAERGARQVEGGWIWHADPRVKSASAFKMTREHNRAVLAALTQPVLLMTAERGYSRYQGLDELLGLIKHGSVKSLPGGHHCHMEDAAAGIARHIHEFLCQTG